MLPWKKVLAFGFLSWLIPFAAGFAAFPLKRVNAPLFASLMMLAVAATAGALFSAFFRKRRVPPRTALGVGLAWLACNLALDYPMFAYGPMQMNTAAYYSEIGAIYLVYPLFACFAARAAA